MRNDYLDYANQDYLEHHGILGQKWGTQNGPPYPLSPSDYSKAEKKLNKYSNKAKQLNRKSERHQRMSDRNKKIYKVTYSHSRGFLGRDREIISGIASNSFKRSERYEKLSIKERERAEEFVEKYIALENEMKKGE